MNPVLAGIYSKFAGSTFATACTGGLHFEVAPQGTAEPYAVYSLVAGRPEYMFTDVSEIVLVQFDLFALVSTTRADLYDKLTTLYDDSTPTATGYTSLIMERTGQQFLREGDQNQIYRAIVEYQVTINKAR
jgi:hypothetical protein